MTHVIIKNIGPIDYAEFDLKKINVIIGPQSSGKSTIDKIVCYCSWVEKRISQDYSFDFFLKDDNFINELIRFHKLYGYLKSGSSISYESKVLKLNYEHGNGVPEFEWVDKYSFRNSKIAYIPAERYLVSAVPNWFDVKLLDNNTLSYLQDWGESRQIHSKDNPFKILNFEASYYFDGNNDNVIIENNGTLLLTNTSSGYQSIIPLNVLLNYFTDYITNDSTPQSTKKKDQLRNTVVKLMKEIIIDDPELTAEIIRYAEQDQNNEIMENSIPSGRFLKLISLSNNFRKYQFANLFIEEPEQNLFPETQKDLLYYLLKTILSNENHRLFLTTHSPYILYALNNCMLGGLLSVQNKLPKEVLEKINCKDSFISPQNVSVYEIRDKKLYSIQGTDGLISDNYFESKMKELMDDFYLMLNYYN